MKDIADAGHPTFGAVQLFLHENLIILVPHLCGGNPGLPFVALVVPRTHPASGQVRDGSVVFSSQWLLLHVGLFRIWRNFEHPQCIIRTNRSSGRPPAVR